MTNVTFPYLYATKLHPQHTRVSVQITAIGILEHTHFAPNRAIIHATNLGKPENTGISTSPRGHHTKKWRGRARLPFILCSFPRAGRQAAHWQTRIFLCPSPTMGQQTEYSRPLPVEKVRLHHRLILCINHNNTEMTRPWVHEIFQSSWKQETINIAMRDNYLQSGT